MASEASDLSLAHSVVCTCASARARLCEFGICALVSRHNCPALYGTCNGGPGGGRAYGTLQIGFTSVPSIARSLGNDAFKYSSAQAQIVRNALKCVRKGVRVFEDVWQAKRDFSWKIR